MNQEVIAGSMLCIIGLMLLIVPANKMWLVTEKWKSLGAEQPSKGYVALMKSLGTVFACVGSGLIVYGALFI